jgi:hypothetical protein
MSIFIPNNIIFSSRFDIQLVDCISRDFEQEDLSLVCGNADIDWGCLFKGKSLVFVDQDEEDLLYDEDLMCYPVQFTDAGLSKRERKEVVDVLAFCGILVEA